MPPKSDADKAAEATNMRAEAAAKTAVEQANANQAGDAPDALKPGEADSTLEFSDLTTANLAVIELREQLAAAKAEHEVASADLAARAVSAEQSLETLKAQMVAGTLTTTQREQAADALGGDVTDAEATEELVPVRVKTPMVVNPDLRGFDPRYDGPEPQPFPLSKGLNHVPRWVAESWIVKANREDEPGEARTELV